MKTPVAKNHFLRIALAALVLTVPAFANTNPSHLDQLVADAKQTQLEAREIGVLLKAKSPDFELVRSRMQTRIQHASKLNDSVAEFEAANATLTPRQQAEFDRIKSAAAVLKIFAENKHGILAGSDVREQRSLLRAKAEGIAKRAELVQVSAHKIRI